MPTLQLKRFEQILDRMITRVVARGALSDLEDSSALKHLLAAVARELDDLHFQATVLADLFAVDKAAGENLDERAKEILPAVLERIGPLASTGSIVFSRGSNTGSTVTVPAGAIVRTADGLTFRTTAQAQITLVSTEQIAGHGVGRDSNTVSAVATSPGSVGNVAPGTITKFQSKPAGIDEVTNTTAFTQGRDEETDDEFRARLRAHVASLVRSTVDALRFLVLGVTDTVSSKVVRFSHVFEDPIDRGNVTVYIDDGAGTAESTTTIVIGTPEVVTFGLAGPPLNSAVGGEEFLDLDNKPVKVESGITLVSEKPAGVPLRGTLTNGTDYFVNPASARVFFDPPLVAGEVIKAAYSHFTGLIKETQKVVDGDPADRLNFPGYRAAGVLVRVLAPVVVQQFVEAVLNIQEGFDRVTVIANADSAVSQYINNLGISGDVIRNEIIERIMEVDGVVDLDLILPTGNVTVLDSEIPRIVDIDIDIT
jgi:uncharacterized phage protein gp47/JayE